MHSLFKDFLEKNPQLAASKKKVQDLAKKDPLFFFSALLLVIILVIFGIKSITPTKVQKIIEGGFDYSNSTVLIVAHSEFDNPTQPTAIRVRFNNPVDPMHLEHQAAIFPKTEGSWKADPYNERVVYYEFEKEFGGKYLLLEINQQLKSTNNKSLTENYKSELKTTTPPRVTQQDTSRVLTIEAGKPVELYSKINAEKPRITIYKSNAQQLLSYLQYKTVDEEQNIIYQRFSDAFIESQVPHTESDIISYTDLRIDYDSSTITFDPGVYYITEDRAKPYFVVVSNYGAILRQDDKNTYLAAFNTKDGSFIDDEVVFGFYNLKDGVIKLKDFVYGGENRETPLPFPTRLDAAIGIHKGEVFFIPVQVPSSNADIRVDQDLSTTPKIFIYTDRPIYKPGDTVFLRGVVRYDNDALYTLPTNKTNLYLSLQGSESIDLDNQITVNNNGTFYTNFVIPEDIELPNSENYSYIYASSEPLNSTNGYRNYGFARIEIAEYKKPTFGLSSSVEKDDYFISDTITFNVKGEYFDKKPLTNKTLTYTLYADNYYEVEKAVYNQNFNISSASGMCGVGFGNDYFGQEYKTGTLKLDASGETTISVPADTELKTSQKVTLVVETTDDKGNTISTAATTTAHKSDLNIFFSPTSTNYKANEQVTAYFHAENLNGEAATNTTFSYEFVDFNYDSYRDEKNILLNGTAVTDQEGNGVVTFTIPESTSIGSKQLVLKTTDSRGETAENQKIIYIIEQNDNQSSFNSYRIDTYLKMSADSNSYQIGDIVELSIDSPVAVDTLVTLERGRIYKQEIVHLEKGENTYSFEVTEAMSPSITIVFSFFENNTYHTEGLAINVPAMHNLLTVNSSLNKETYDPSENAKLLITTTDNKGNPVSANVTVGIVDKAIYTLRKSATPLIHSNFYYFRPRSTNATSSLIGIGNPYGLDGRGGGGGNAGLGNAADILYWNPTAKTDANGELRLNIPLLGYETTWNILTIATTGDTKVGQDDIEFTVTTN